MFYSKKFLKFKEINHCFFSRKGGFSTGIYKGLNCGKGSRDDKKKISKNLSLVSKRMEVKKKDLILMNQTHSERVFEIKKNNYLKKIDSDAIITRRNKIALGVVTADCVPILIYDKENKIVGCIHAGWKGAFLGIIENTVSRIRRISSKSQIYASVGPCIGKKNYEVDITFFKRFIKKSKKNKKYFSKKNKLKFLFNLRKFVADKLLGLKISVDHVNHDTFEEKNNFFSYRRSCKLNQSDYGRCISVIRLI